MKGSCEVIGNEQKYFEGLNHELTLLNTCVKFVVLCFVHGWKFKANENCDPSLVVT